MALGAMLVLAALTSIQQKNKTNLLEDGVLESIESTCAGRTIIPTQNSSLYPSPIVIVQILISALDRRISSLDLYRPYF
jgi:hypothetical protein